VEKCARITHCVVRLVVRLVVGISNSRGNMQLWTLDF
jgi:hypothetical protein